MSGYRENTILRPTSCGVRVRGPLIQPQGHQGLAEEQPKLVRSCRWLVFKLVVLGLVALGAMAPVRASLILSSPGTTYSIDFADFTGAGFASTPSAGQLNSDDWAVTLRDSDISFTFGGNPTDARFAKGSASGSVSNGGVYAFDVGGGNPALGIQPIGTIFTPGWFTLRLQNDTGQTLTALDIAYDVYVLNDQDRANSFKFSHSADDVTYTSVNSLDLTSPAAKDSSPSWTQNQRNTTLNGLSIAAGSQYYVRWSGADVGGSNYRDQFALDHIRITGLVPEPGSVGLLTGMGVAVILGASLLRTRRHSERERRAP